MSFLAPVFAGEEAEELELPECGTATTIKLSLKPWWRLQWSPLRCPRIARV
jgi:hypothetical protein